MKKFILILAISVSFTLIACGPSSTTNEKKDSTTNIVDSVSVKTDSVKSVK
jgi:hypothetical protein